MTGEQINIAIAEACGWTDIHGGPPNGICWRGIDPANPGGLMRPIPDYCNDLNAMHTAEDRLTPHQRINHGRILQDLLNEHAVGFVPDYDRDLASLSRIASAKALLRAEAFLRAVGKWKEDV